MTKEEIVDKLVNILIRKQSASHDWSELVAGVGLFTDEEKQTVVDSIFSGDKDTLMSLMRFALVTNNENTIRIEVENMLVDDQLSLIELESFL